MERDAAHELARLVPLLELSPEQQSRVFQALARSSPNFVAGMQVDGTSLQPSTGNPQQPLLDELSDSQVETYLQDSDESSAWWSEYIDNAASQLAGDGPAVGSTAEVAPGEATAPVETAPGSKAAHSNTGDE